MRRYLALAVIIGLLIPLAAMAGEDDIAVISLVRPEEGITLKVLRNIYLKKKMVWKDGRMIIPLNLPPQNRLRVIFSEKILRKEPRELVEYWNEQYFKGVTPPVVLESEEAVKRFVIEVEGTIGYIRKKNLEPGLEVLYVIEVN